MTAFWQHVSSSQQKTHILIIVFHISPNTQEKRKMQLLKHFHLDLINQNFRRLIKSLPCTNIIVKVHWQNKQSQNYFTNVLCNTSVLFTSNWERKFGMVLTLDDQSMVQSFYFSDLNQQCKGGTKKKTKNDQSRLHRLWIQKFASIYLPRLSTKSQNANNIIL